MFDNKSTFLGSAVTVYGTKRHLLISVGSVSQNSSSSDLEITTASSEKPGMQYMQAMQTHILTIARIAILKLKEITSIKRCCLAKIQIIVDRQKPVVSNR